MGFQFWGLHRLRKSYVGYLAIFEVISEIIEIDVKVENWSS